MGFAGQKKTDTEALMEPRPGRVYDVTKEKPEAPDGFAANFVRSLFDAGVQLPWNGIAQLVDRVTGKVVLPEMHVVEPAKPARVWTADWCGQLLGGSVGMAASYTMTRQVCGKLLSTGPRALVGNQISAEAAFAQEVPFGAFYSSVCAPVQFGEGEFWSARFRHGVSGGLTMGTLAGVGSGIGNKIASTESMAARHILGNKPVLGMLSGIPAGFVSAESSSLLSGHGFARSGDVAQTSLELALVGGTLGIAHECLPSAHRNGLIGSEVVGERNLLNGAVAGEGKAAGKDQVLSDARSDRRIEEQSAEIVALRIELEEARKLATVDPLTGALNRRAAMEALTKEISAARRRRDPLSVIFLDLDHFKCINDNPLYGHAGGDAALIATANILRRSVRPYDSVCRMGGEEFCVILPRTDIQTAEKLAHRLRGKLDTTVSFGEQNIPITASFGVATLGLEASPEELLNRADRAMYMAKETGRNRVVLDGLRESAVGH